MLCIDCTAKVYGDIKLCTTCILKRKAFAKKKALESLDTIRDEFYLNGKIPSVIIANSIVYIKTYLENENF